jgi:antitoxin HicB
MMLYAYPARLKAFPAEVVVQFRDLPEATAGGRDREEAMRHAEGVLEAALWFRLKEEQKIPAPSLPRRGDVMIPVRPAIAAKVAFASAFHASGITRLELARRLGLNDKEVRRMLDPDHPTKIERLDEAMRVLGRRLMVAEQAA